MTTLPLARRRLHVPLALVVGFLAIYSAAQLAAVIRLQIPGIDFLAMWAGGRASGLDVSRLYDIGYLTALQGWPLGPHNLRPFPYPPTALFLFAPLSALPWQVAYSLWLAVSIPAFAWAGRRMGAPWWFLLFPWVAFAAFCGQITLLLGALVLLGLTERKARPVLAGVLFGVAASIKPQVLLLLPVALLVERRWTVLVITGATGLLICAATAVVWGLGAWMDWLGSLDDFSQIVNAPRQTNAAAITPTAALLYWGLDRRWAALAVVPATALVWWAFRKEKPHETQLIALAGGTFLVSPYALNYELALFAPAVALYLTRTGDRRWTGYLAATFLVCLVWQPASLNLLAVLSLPAIGSIRRRPTERTAAAELADLP